MNSNSQAQKGFSSRKKSGFSLPELLCALLITGLFAVLVVSVAAYARQEAAKKSCLSGIKSTGTALLMYSQDYDGAFPPIMSTKGNKDSVAWVDTLLPYLHNTLPVCPTRIVAPEFEEYRLATGYAYNSWLNETVTLGSEERPVGKTETVVAYPRRTVAFLEARPGIIALGDCDTEQRLPVTAHLERVYYLSQLLRDAMLTQIPAATRHDGGANYAFLDGHATWLPPTAFQNRCDGTKPCFVP